MRANIQQIKQALKAGKIEDLFKEELGWDKLPEAPPEISYKSQMYAFKPLAQKVGFKIYLHTFPGRIPEDRFLYQLDKRLNDFAAEHLTIFVDANRENQVWVWVKREQENNKLRSKLRLRKFNKNQSGDLLAQRLERLFISLDEEELVTLTTILDRVRQGFDVEKITKTFYGLFKQKHMYFLERIENIPDDDEHKDDREWYTSIMLNRLMFIYFIQRKKLLDNKSSVRFDGDEDYLQNRLSMIRTKYGPDNFYAFYRSFLRRLFHEGLSQPESNHTSELENIIGKVPYINGGLFDVHILEQKYPDIQIKDEVFEEVFAFFERFDWHLDDRPMRNDREINPDVLGYIFEKYINQKQMGAYYTKEDITEYISKNAIVPFLFEKVAQFYPNAFVAGEPIWSLLKDNPDEYIYDAMAHGVLEPLPPEIEAGIIDVAQRTSWNKPADVQFALPTETWREVVKRRQRYEETYEKMIKGEISRINDLVTYNLNITQFAKDVITECEEPGLLRAFYDTIKQITVLDPTCGSGAFLFAALNILKPLYQTCIERMRLLVTQYKAQRKESSHITAFQQTLDLVDQHQSQEYFILKSIIINNLYGVDIMEEAIEICKLRLFLKLVAQIEKPQDLEPLPDIDFNVLAGNTLIGFTSMDDVRRVVTTKLVKMDNTEETLQIIEREAQEIERDEQSFRNMQTRQAIKVNTTTISEYKQQLRKKLEKLRGKLDPYLATEYGIDHNNIPVEQKYQERYEQWHKTHKPFHWWVEFYGIMKQGGFNVIVGNPPWVEYRNVSNQYTLLNFSTLDCNNLWAFVTERSMNLLNPLGRCSLIVPMSLVCTERMISIQEKLRSTGISWISNYESDSNPGQLFHGVKQNVSILIYQPSNHPDQYTTKLHRFFSKERDNVFSTVQYTELINNHVNFGFAKISERTESQILKKLFMHSPIMNQLSQRDGDRIYVHRIAHYYIKCFDFIPYFKSTRDGIKKSEDYKEYSFQKPIEPFVALINSSIFYFYWQVFYDSFKAGKQCVEGFPCAPITDNTLIEMLTKYCHELMEDIKRNAQRLEARYAATGEVEYDQFYPRKSKTIIDEIDHVLAQHYRFTPEELDFIINYDIKYRMGRDNGEESEE